MRILRGKLWKAAVLAAVLALAAAGSAVAATDYVWNGTNNDWATAANWTPNGTPGDGDTVSFGGDATISTLGGAVTVDALKFTGNATLTLSDAANALTAKKIVVDAGKNATVTSNGGDGNFKIEDTNSVIELAENATLTLDGTRTVKGIGELQLPGKGKLVLKQEMTTVNDLKIENGGTLELNGGKLPAFDSNSTLRKTIPHGNIILGTENAFHDNLDTLTIMKGNLTLKKKQKPKLRTIGVGEGTLTIEDGVTIGNGNPTDPDGAIILGKTLDLKGDMTLKELKASHTTSTIKIASGKTLSVVKPDVLPAMAAAVEGNLLFDLSASATVDKVTLNGNVDGKVTFKGAAAQQKSLELGSNVTVKELVLDGGSADKAKLTLKGNSN